MSVPLFYASERDSRTESANEVMAWDQTAPQGTVPYRVVSLFAPAPLLDVERFLRGSYGQERFYWAEPDSADNPMTLAGLGIAAEVSIPPVLDSADDVPSLPGHRFSAVAHEAKSLFERAIILPVDWVAGDGIEERLQRHLARPRLFGGFAFQDDFIPDNTWSVFSPAQFVLPHYQFVQRGDSAFLTINALVPWDEDIVSCHSGLKEALIARLALVLPKDNVSSNSIASLNYPMPASQWAEIIDQAGQSIRCGELEKVVLSRVCEVRTDQPIDAVATLPYLNRNYNDCYRFIFEPVPHHAFFGATPELLISKKSDRIATMALAGSIGRGQSQEEDAAQGRQLLASAKNRHEHQLVLDIIRNNFKAVTAELDNTPEPDLLMLRNIQHLITPVNGRLSDPNMSVLSLVRLLHPTPAMGGVPAVTALSQLRLLEPVPRGWYAAPIGWFDAQDDGEFAVAIRSAVSQYSRAWLYAGAGIVADSDAGQEWAETALKFRPMLGALGAEGNLLWN